VRVLLAGNRGYLGSVLQDLLIQVGYDVIGVDTGFYDADPMQPRQDIRHMPAEDFVGCDAVVNLAAMCNDACGNLSTTVTYQINTDAAVRMARMAKSHGVRTYVFASSCSVYGVADDAGERTEIDAVAPETAYAASKVCAERELLKLADDGFDPVALRFATLFGDSPSFRSDLLVNRIALTASRWGKIVMNGEGQLWRPLLHVRDAARAVRAVIEADVGLGGHVFNVGFSDQNHRIVDIVEMARELVPGATVTKTPAADNRTYAVSFDKFHETFPGLRSSSSVAAGLREVLEAYRRRLRLPLSAAGDGWASTDRCRRLLAMRTAGYLDPGFHWNVPSLVAA
jgi:nucleoside-diphosphate-sugar epimerase